MCGICTLPTTHANTFSTISMASLFLMVFWTFIWAWWVVTKIRVENYFVDLFRSVVAARKVGYGFTFRRLLKESRQFQIVLVLLVASVTVLLWASFTSPQVVTLVEPIYTDQYIAVPIINSEGEEILQLNRI